VGIGAYVRGVVGGSGGGWCWQKGVGVCLEVGIPWEGRRVMLHIIHLSSFCPLKIDVALKITIGSKSNNDLSKI
jgi:hypothetical protein